MDPQLEASNAVPEPVRKGWFSALRSRRKAAPGQAMVEFAIVSVAFFMMVFGTVDFGRAIYMYSQLHNAVEKGARVGKTDPVGHTAIQNAVVDAASSFDLDADDVTVTCYKSDGMLTTDCSTSSKIQVSASAGFQAITQEFLGIGPVTLTAKSRAATEQPQPDRW